MAGWYEGHVSAGVVETGVEWQLAGAQVGGPRGVPRLSADRQHRRHGRARRRCAWCSPTGAWDCGRAQGGLKVKIRSVALRGLGKAHAADAAVVRRAWL